MTSPGGGGPAIAGSVALDVEPDAKDFYPRLKAQVLPGADQLGRELGRTIGAAVSKQVADAIGDAIRNGGKTAEGDAARVGSRIGSTLARTLKARLESALKTLPKIKIDADTTPAEKKLAAFRAKLEAIRDKVINIDIEFGGAAAKIAALKADLLALAAEVRAVRTAGGPIDLSLDVASLKAKLAAAVAALEAARREGNRAISPRLDTSFAGKFQAAMRAAVANVGRIDIRANTAPADVALARIRGQLEALSNKRIGVDISAEDAIRKAEALAAKFRALAATAVTFNARFDAERAAAGVEAFIAQIRTASTEPLSIEAEVDLPQTFATQFRAKIKAALSNLPKIEITATTAPADLAIARLRGKLISLGDKVIGVDISADDAIAQATKLEAEFRTLAATTVDVQARFHAERAAAQLAAFIQQVRVASTERLSIEAEVSAGLSRTFAVEFRAKMKAALANLPKIEIDATTAPADVALARLRGQLIALGDKTIGVDIDAGQALAQAEALELKFRELAANTVDIEAKFNAARASAQLRAYIAEVKAASANEINTDVDVDTSGAIAQILALIFTAQAGRFALIGLASSGIALTTLLIPAIAGVVAMLGAVGPAALVGAAGVGALALGLIGPLGALREVSAAQDSGAKSASNLAGKQNAVANAMQSLAAARRGLTNTLANAAEAEERAARGVRDADKALAEAQRDAMRAQQDITRARVEAARAMEDLNSAVANGALSQRGALLDLAEAQITLDETMNNPQSTNIQRQRAQLAYDQAKQQIEDLGVRQERLAEEQVDAQQRGIENSTQVQAANEAAAAAQDKVTAAVESLILAQREQASTARQNEFAIQQATDGVASAQRALAQSYQSAGAAGESAAQRAEKALAKLSPAGRQFVLFLLSIKGAFKQVQGAAEAGLLPGLEAGIRAFLPVLPLVAVFIGQVATAMGDLFAKAGQALTAPFWVDFFAQLGNFAGPALESFGSIIGGLAEGFASLILAFLPFSDSFGKGLAGMMQSFAAWAAQLGASNGFKSFIAYVREEGPKLLGFLGDFFVVVYKLGIGLAPLGKVVLEVAGALFAWMSSLDPVWILAIAAAIGALIAGIAIAVAGPILAIAAGITLVVGLVVYLWTHFKTFRDVTLAVWDAIKTASVFLWDYVLKYVFAGIAEAVNTLAIVLTWLWKNVVVPVFSGIAMVVSWAWENIIKPAFEALSAFITEYIVPILTWLWHNVFEPVWQGIQIAVSIAWAIIQVIFGLIQIAVKILAAIFMAFWKSTIEPIWNGISTAISYVWRTFLKPVFEAFGDIIEKYVAPAFKRGVDAIGKAWDAVREIAKVPIKFVIEEVLNKGLLSAYNWVAKTFKVKPDDVQIPLPKGFAGGGFITGPGGPTDDAILARLSAGEYVIPAQIVRRYGIEFFDQMIGRGAAAASSRPGDGSEGLALPAFADGGLVGFLSSAWNTLTDPIKYIREKVGELMGKVPGGEYVQKVVAGVGNDTVGKVLEWVRGKITNAFTGSYNGPVSAEVADVQNWVRQQHGKPYVWAAAGPQGYDCSGLQSSVWNIMHGKPPYSHTFSTSGQAAYFPLPGYGVHTAGYAHAGEKGGGRVGHTAGVLAGLKFESRGSDGVVVGAGATDVSTFARLGHYDAGGWLMPGITIARNDTGRPEPVLTGNQWSDLLDARQQPTAAVGGNTYNVYPRVATLDATQLQAITTAQDIRDRMGRPS